MEQAFMDSMMEDAVKEVRSMFTEPIKYKKWLGYDQTTPGGLDTKYRWFVYANKKAEITSATAADLVFSGAVIMPGDLKCEIDFKVLEDVPGNPSADTFYQKKGRPSDRIIWHDREYRIVGRVWARTFAGKPQYYTLHLTPIGDVSV
jgi:hypothetical protein